MRAASSASCDVAIVGGGPAGLAAAIELKRLGIYSVAVVEREAEAGGVPRHCGHYPFGMRELARLLRGPEYAARLVRCAQDCGVDIWSRTTVAAVHPGPSLTLSSDAGLARLDARKVLLATGIRERTRAARLIGGTKPAGIMSTGALQGLVHLDKLKPFHRPVVLGSELVSFSALLTCHHAAMEPVAMIEPDTRITAWTGSWLLPRLLGVRLMLETAVTRILGVTKVEAVEVRDGRQATHTIETDGVIVSGCFQPEAALVRSSHLEFDPASGGPRVDQFLRLSDPDYFAAGNLLRPVETAGWCWEEGRRAARMIARSLEGTLPDGKSGVDVVIAGTSLKLAVPQRLVASDIDCALADLQIRVRRPVRGHLSIELDGRKVWQQHISALPERRILVPLDWLRPKMHGRAELSITEVSA